MKFTMRHPISHQRMVIPLGIEALSLYLPQSRIKNIHLLARFKSFLKEDVILTSILQLFPCPLR